MIYLLFIWMLTLFIFSLYYFNMEIMSPSIISTGMFFVATGVAVLNKSSWKLEDYSTTSFLILATGMTCAVLTECIVKSAYNGRNKKSVPDGQRIISINMSLSILLIALSIVFLALYIRAAIKLANGAASFFGGSVFFRINQFSKRSIELGLGEGISSVYVQFGKIITCLAYIYIYKMINNLINGQHVLKNIDSIIMTVLYFVLVIFQGTRSPIINLSVFCFVCYYSKYMQKKGWLNKKSVGRKFIKRACSIGIFAVPAFFWFGEYVLGRHTGNTIWQYVSEYIAGGILHFDQYIKDPIAPNSHFGEETLAYVYQGLYKLHLSDFTRTIHNEYRWTTELIHGNVYTFFRRPLQDYGIIGMYIFTFLVFGFYSSVYYKHIRNSIPSFKSDAWLFFIAYIYFPLLYVPIDSSGIANLISIGNILMYIIMLALFNLAFRVKVKVRK